MRLMQGINKHMYPSNLLPAYFLRQHSSGEGQNGIHKYGTLEFQLPGGPFLPKPPVESATTGKRFVCQLLDKMYSLGYDFVVSSDLTRQTDQVIILGKIFGFKKSLCHIIICCIHTQIINLTRLDITI